MSAAAKFSIVREGLLEPGRGITWSPTGCDKVEKVNGIALMHRRVRLTETCNPGYAELRITDTLLLCEFRDLVDDGLIVLSCLERAHSQSLQASWKESHVEYVHTSQLQARVVQEVQPRS